LFDGVERLLDLIAQRRRRLLGNCGEDPLLSVVARRRRPKRPADSCHEHEHQGKQRERQVISDRRRQHRAATISKMAVRVEDADEELADFVHRGAIGWLLIRTGDCRPP
jgi:hypothetical protein